MLPTLTGQLFARNHAHESRSTHTDTPRQKTDSQMHTGRHESTHARSRGGQECKQTRNRTHTSTPPSLRLYACMHTSTSARTHARWKALRTKVRTGKQPTSRNEIHSRKDQSHVLCRMVEEIINSSTIRRLSIRRPAGRQSVLERTAAPRSARRPRSGTTRSPRRNARSLAG